VTQRNSKSDSVVRACLRQATHPFHVRLNQHPLLHGLSQRDLSLPSYRRLLLAYFQLYSVLETRILHYLERQSCSFQYSERNKLSWLIKDLLFFHEEIPGIDAQRWDFPAIENPAQLTGVLYTLEGSTLGGQHISRCLEKSHGLTTDGGACFFNGYGERTQAMWQAFLDFAESLSVPEHAEAACSAVHVFELFEKVLGELPSRECVAGQVNV
jgi:heme oxygenase